MIAIKNILVATDFSMASDAALRYGKTFARTYGAALHVVHVMDDLSARLAMPAEPIIPDVGQLQTEMDREAQRALDNLVTDDDRRSYPVTTALLMSAQPAQTLLVYAHDESIDLIIVGTHGRGGLSELLMGSVAQHIVRDAPCPVLTVRHPEREFIRPDALAARETPEARPRA